MASKYIKIPDPVLMVDLSTNKPLYRESTEEEKAAGQTQVQLSFTFQNFFVGTILKDPKLGETADGLLASREVLKAIKSKSPGDIIEIESDDWEKIVPIIKKPTGGYNTQLGIQCLPFMEAFLNASDRKPQEEKPEKSKKS